jgi:hypothetical protein
MQFANQQALGFVQDQTLRINAEVYKQAYPATNYAELVPVDSNGPEWSRGVVTYISDRVGVARWQSGNAKDMPLADVNRSSTQTFFELAAVGYDYNLEEIETARLVPGTNLTNDKADAAREASQDFLYNLAILGDTNKGWTGLANNALVPFGNVALNAGAASRLWVNKTTDEILADVNSTLTGLYLGSNTVEIADTLLLPIDSMLLASQKRLDVTSQETLLSYLARTNTYTVTTGQPLLIRAVRGLDTAGAGGTRRMIAYSRNPRVLSFFLPMPHRFLPVWQNGPLNFLVPGIFRTGGTEVKRPLAVRYADGI